MKKLLLALLAAGIGVAIWWSCKHCHPPGPPHLPEEWWGPAEMRNKVDNSVKPFQVKFDEAVIKDLKDRLKKHRPMTPPLEGVGFQYGFNQNQLDSWISYWAEKYPFAEREKFLNKYPQFKTNVQGLDIHFIRVKPQVPTNVQVVPLLLMHGWPGSVREFYEAIPLLTKQMPGYDFAFEVIVPSLPGYGFSDAAVRPGLGANQVSVVMRNLMRRLGFKQFYVQGGDAGAVVASGMATLFPDEVLGHHSNMLSTQAAVRPGLGANQVSVVMRNLMRRLGFKQFYVQGGDWGAVVASGMATLFPDEVLGHHSNMLITQNKCSMTMYILGSMFPSLVVEPHLADRMYPISKFFGYLMEEFGYMHLQSTKPDTVGVALTDSPAGLLAYILEKFSTWTNIEYKGLQDGGLLKKFSKDQLLDNLMMYWTSNSITTSMRLYAETMSNKHRALNFDDIPTPVPTWALQSKYELFYQPPTLLKKKYLNLVNTTVLDDGGHFLAFEMPQVFSEDVFRAVKAFREFHTNKPKTEL